MKAKETHSEKERARKSGEKCTSEAERRQRHILLPKWLFMFIVSLLLPHLVWMSHRFSFCDNEREKNAKKDQKAGWERVRTQGNLHTTPSFYGRLSATFTLCWADFCDDGASFIDSRWALKEGKFRAILIITKANCFHWYPLSEFLQLYVKRRLDSSLVTRLCSSYAELGFNNHGSLNLFSFTWATGHWQMNHGELGFTSLIPLMN